MKWILFMSWAFDDDRRTKDLVEQVLGPDDQWPSDAGEWTFDSLAEADAMIGRVLELELPTRLECLELSAEILSPEDPL